MHRLFLFFGWTMLAGPVAADVFISEYVEGSGLNKGLELYSTDAGGVDLAADGCEIRGYQNGSASVGWTVALTGAIPPNGVYVLAHPDAAFGGDQTGNLQFNGDDAVALVCGGSLIDVIGQIGFDPGSEWGSGNTSTANNTLRRKATVCSGDAEGSDAFDPAAEWDGFAQDEFSGLGAHGASCGPDTTPPEIVSVTPSTGGPTAATQLAFAVLFSEAISDFDDPTDIMVNTSGTSFGGLTFIANSPTSHSVVVDNISGAGTLSLTVNAGAVVDGAGNANTDTRTSAPVLIDPNANVGLPVGLLLSEIVVTPNAAEFVEIVNTSNQTIDLSEVYLTDATFANGNTFYYQVVQGAGGGGGFNDFHARFPAGATIASGARQTIALAGSTAFESAWGIAPDYELYEDGSADGIPEMREAFPGSIAGQGGLSDGVNDGEVLILYHWNGQSDRVADLDYALWGDRTEAVDKTGVAIDGPDADAQTSTYLPDTSVGLQAVIDASAHSAGAAWQRIDPTEGNEIDAGGNGIDGDDETSEPFRITWGAGAATPGAAPGPDVLPPGPNVLINELDAIADPADEFIELFDGGLGQTDLTGLALVFYDDASQAYAALDLDGLRTSASGYLVAGGAATAPDVALPTAISDGAAAVALVIGDAANYPPGAPLDAARVIDAIVHGSGQPAVPGLLTLLEPGESQVDEDLNCSAALDSLQRCPNGAGGRRRTASYSTVPPSPGLANTDCPVGDYYAGVDPASPSSLRQTLHQIIDDHQWYPYTAGSTDTWDILELADEDPNDTGQILSLYRNATYAKAGGGNSFYNREHTWPRSYGLGQTDTPQNTAATDAHNLRLSDIDYNSDRGNKPFADCDPGINPDCAELVTVANNGAGGIGGPYPGDSNWFTQSTDGNQGHFEVWSDRRGDAARTAFYMGVRYEGGTHAITGFAEPDLVLTNDRNLIQTTGIGTAYMGLLDVLLAWHAEDPVDEKERLRNEVVFLFQGNRNPFVDHPEWVDCIWLGTCELPELLFADSFEAGAAGACRRRTPSGGARAVISRSAPARR